MVTAKRKVFILVIFAFLMQLKLLANAIIELLGKQSADLILLLDGKKNMNEFIIAKKLTITINQVRNILYKLSVYDFITSTRKKDKRKGWYTYFWTLNQLKFLEFFRNNLQNKIKEFEAKLNSRSSKIFYLCDTCKTEVNEETALLHDFICIECGQVYKLSENKKLISELENKISKLKKQLLIIEEEVNKHKKANEKKELRREKREVVKKVKERKKKAKARERERKKARKREVRKLVKKKIKQKKVRKLSKKKIKRKKR